MAESECHSTELLVSGGFRIEIAADELTVTKTRGKNKYLVLPLAVFVGYLVWDNRSSWLLILLVAALFGIRYWFSAIHNLRCTRETVEVIDILPGRAQKTTSYARVDVKEVRFGEVGLSRYGSVNGLIFDVADKKVKTLSGLESPEAQRILNELQRLGFNTYNDPGMPMMADIEKSHRKFGLS